MPYQSFNLALTVPKRALHHGLLTGDSLLETTLLARSSLFDEIPERPWRLYWRRCGLPTCRPVDRASGEGSVLWSRGHQSGLTA